MGWCWWWRGNGLDCFKLRNIALVGRWWQRRRATKIQIQTQLGRLEIWWGLIHIWKGHSLNRKLTWILKRKKKWNLREGCYQENNSSAGVRPTHQTSWTKQHRWCILPFLHFFFICQFFIFFCNYSVLVPNFQTDPRSSMLMSSSEVSPRSTMSKWWKLTLCHMFDFELRLFYAAFLIL